MAEHVVPLDLGVTWEPNAPSAVLISADGGLTALALEPHPDDKDSRCVVAIWSGAAFTSLSDPNDEAVSGHRLYRRGLADVLWAGLVSGSARVGALERQNRVHPHHDPSRVRRLQHHVLLTKECVVEVVAEALEVRRISGPTLEAAVAAVRR